MTTMASYLFCGAILLAVVGVFYLLHTSGGAGPTLGVALILGSALGWLAADQVMAMARRAARTKRRNGEDLGADDLNLLRSHGAIH